MEKGGEPMQECFMELINAMGTWFLWEAENPYEVHIRTIFLEQEWEIYPPTSMVLWSNLPTGQNGNSLYFCVVCMNFKGFFSRMSCTGGSKKPQAEVRGGIEVDTVCLYFCKAGWSLHEIGHHCCDWEQRQGHKNLKICLRSIWCPLHTVVQVIYCSTLEGTIHIIRVVSYFPVPCIRSQLRFCLKELSWLKKKIWKWWKNEMFKNHCFKIIWRNNGKDKLQNRWQK